MSEFFGFGGYQRPAEGYMSIEHLAFVSSLMVIMFACAIFLGIRNRGKNDKLKNRVLIISAILIDAFELFKIVLVCVRSQNAMQWLYDLPLFLCSIQLITIPLAAFSKGRVREAALDFVMIFGLLGAILGTYFAGNNYSAYPVLSFDNVVSGITHSISGFCAIYIVVSGMSSMKKRNVPITLGILGAFATAAFIVNKMIDYNYMFLERGDGTPYDILFNLVNGNSVLYPIGVMVLFVIYIALFYGAFYLVDKEKE